MDKSKFAGKIDYTILNKRYGRKDVCRVVREAETYGMNVCIPPSSVEWVANHGFVNELVSVVGFPNGYNEPRSKSGEGTRLHGLGATELDVACNLGLLDRPDRFRDDIEGVVEAGETVKAIIETPLLGDDEVQIASELCVEAGVDYIKTCTGFYGGVEVDDVELIRGVVGESVGIKASGGIRSYSEAVELLEAGASRIGSSSGVEIVQGFSRKN